MPVLEAIPRPDLAGAVLLSLPGSQYTADDGGKQSEEQFFHGVRSYSLNGLAGKRQRPWEQAPIKNNKHTCYLMGKVRCCYWRTPLLLTIFGAGQVLLMEAEHREGPIRGGATWTVVVRWWVVMGPRPLRAARCWVPSGAPGRRWRRASGSRP